jgi:hypothetical protein
MGSRIRENVKHFFECFCEVVPATVDKEAWIIQQYPDKYKDEEVLKSVPKFAYPYKFENTVIQHYSFVLTDLESKWTFGFCRHDPRSETAIVVLSYLPWHQAFYKYVQNIQDDQEVDDTLSFHIRTMRFNFCRFRIVDKMFTRRAASGINMWIISVVFLACTF